MTTAPPLASPAPTPASPALPLASLAPSPGAPVGRKLAEPISATAGSSAAVGNLAAKSLVPAPKPGHPPDAWTTNPRLASLPVELDVSVQVRDFRVRNLLALDPGQVIATRWLHGDDVPLWAGEVLLAWSEFEVTDTQLAARVTRLP